MDGRRACPPLMEERCCKSQEKEVVREVLHRNPEFSKSATQVSKGTSELCLSRHTHVQIRARRCDDQGGYLGGENLVEQDLHLAGVAHVRQHLHQAVHEADVLPAVVLETDCVCVAHNKAGGD